MTDRDIDGWLRAVKQMRGLDLSGTPVTDALVEVLPESTEAWDRGGKFAHYRRIPSLRAYVLVSQHERRIEVYQRADDGRWTLDEAVGEGTVAIACLAGALDLERVYRGIALSAAKRA